MRKIKHPFWGEEDAFVAGILFLTGTLQTQAHSRAS